jgi:hypothetical protein
MADDLNEIRISITLDDGSVREGFARIKKSGEEAGDGLSHAFAHVRNEILAIVGAYLSFEFGKEIIEKSIEAAGGYEKALNNMNKALSSSGSYSAEASASFLELAENIEKTTTLSATQALGLEALARNYARNNEQAKALTSAAIDLAAATGKSADAALQQLGGTLDGTSGRLGKLIPQIRSLTEFQLRAGEAIAIVGARFKDAASGDVDTFEGSITRLKNSFEKLGIAFGQAFTGNDTVRAVIKFITGEIDHLAESMQHTFGDQNYLKQFALDSITVGKALNDFIIYPLELVANTAALVFNAVGATIVDFIGGIVDIGNKLVNFFAPNSAIAKSLKDFVDNAKELMNDLDAKASKNLENIGNSDFSTSIENGLNRLTGVVNNAKPFDRMREHVNGVKDDLLGLSGGLESAASSFTLLQQGASNGFELMAHNAQKAFQDIGAATSKTLVGGFSNAMVQLGRALVQGKDLFKAFAGAILSAMGQAAIQMGSFYILEGIARGFSSYGFDATAYGLISAGSALTVLGGVLGAVGEGVSGGGSNAGGVGSGVTGGFSGDSGGGGAPNPATAVQQKEQQTVTVNINGSVFDTHETGLRIVELVNSAFNTQGAQVLVK